MFRILVFLSCLWLAACSSPSVEQPTPKIAIDQFGYLPDLEKRAIIRSPEIGYDAKESFTPGNRYAVINVETGEAVYEGVPEVWNEGRIHEQSGDKVWWFDFSAVG